MHLHKEIERFIKDCYPKGLPLYKRKDLKKELLSHIYDKADFYIAQGKSEEESVIEAVREMGEPAKIRQSFGRIYRFERLPGIITFFAFVLISISAAFLGFLTFGADSTGDYPTVFHYFISAAFIGSNIFLYVYSFRKKNLYLLLSVTVFMLLSFCTFFISGGIFQSALIGIAVIICAVFGIPEETVIISGMYIEAETIALCFGFYGGFILTAFLFLVGVILAVLLLTETKRRKKIKKCRNKKPLAFYFTFILSLVIISSVMFYMMSREYDFVQYNTLSNSILRYGNTKKARAAYEELTAHTDETEAQVIFRSYGFSEYKNKNDGMYRQELDPAYSIPGARIFCLENDSFSYDPLYNDCVIVVNFSDGKLIFKQLYCYKKSTIAIGISKKEDTAECYENYLSLNEGDKQEDVMKKFPSSVAFLKIAYFDFERNTEKLHFESDNDNWSDYDKSANIKVELDFVDGILKSKKINAFGNDGTYNYKEMGNLP